MIDAPPGGNRLFFAALPGSATLRRLEAVLGALPAGVGRRVAPRDLHLTLAFVGAVVGSRLDCLRTGARRVAAPEVDLCLDRLGCFPRAAVLWLGPEAVPEVLSGLASDLAGVLSACGVTPDARPFAPHVTLARRVRCLPPGLQMGPVAWRSCGFALMESVRGPRGAAYRIVERYEP